MMSFLLVSSLSESDPSFLPLFLEEKWPTIVFNLFSFLSKAQQGNQIKLATFFKKNSANSALIVLPLVQRGFILFVLYADDVVVCTSCF